MPVDAEQISKTVQSVLRSDLNAMIDTVRQEWSVPNTIMSLITLPADPIDLKNIDVKDIQIGSVNVVQATSNFPSVWVWVVDEDPAVEGEQDYAHTVNTLAVRVLVQGMTVEHSSKQAYRYADAVRRVLLNSTVLNGMGLGLRAPRIVYVPAEDEPLYKAAHMEFRMNSIVAW